MAGKKKKKSPTKRPKITFDQNTLELEAPVQPHPEKPTGQKSHPPNTVTGDSGSDDFLQLDVLSPMVSFENPNKGKLSSSENSSYETQQMSEDEEWESDNPDKSELYNRRPDMSKNNSPHGIVTSKGMEPCQRNSNDPQTGNTQKEVGLIGDGAMGRAQRVKNFAGRKVQTARWDMADDDPGFSLTDEEREAGSRFCKLPMNQNRTCRRPAVSVPSSPPVAEGPSTKKTCCPPRVSTTTLVLNPDVATIGGQLTASQEATCLAMYCNGIGGNAIGENSGGTEVDGNIRSAQAPLQEIGKVVHSHEKGNGQISDGGKLAVNDKPSSQWRDLFSNNRSPGLCPKLRHFSLNTEKKACWLIQEDVKNDIWKQCLIGYIAGKSPGYKALNAIISVTWKVEASLIMHESGWLVYKFSSEEDRMSVLNSGPYLIYGRPLILKPMPEFFNFSTKEMSTAPVWVKFPCLPLQCWSTTCLSKIASVLGKPLQCDRLTASMDRLSYARVLVEIDIMGDLLHFVDIHFPTGETLKQPVVYESMPVHCKVCKVLGHHTNTCRKGAHQKSAPKESDHNTGIIHKGQQSKGKETDPVAQESADPSRASVFERRGDENEVQIEDTR